MLRERRQAEAQDIDAGNEAGSQRDPHKKFETASVERAHHIFSDTETEPNPVNTLD
jgi:hypothetical protein